MTGLRRSAAVIAAAALALPLAAAGQEAEPLVTMIPLDGEAMVGGIAAACTGIGQTRLDPRWAAYPVRVEFSNAKNEYLIGATVTLSTADGKPLAAIDCDGPWVLLKPPPGRYVVQARINGSPAKPRTAPVQPPSSGQIRVVLQFPDA